MIRQLARIIGVELARDREDASFGVDVSGYLVDSLLIRAVFRVV